jgi:cathepsin C
MKNLIVLSLVLALLSVAFADLPVHCLYKTTKGDWEFELTSQDHDKTVVKQCDIRTDISSKVVKTMKVSLQVPNIAVDDQGHQGTWTLIYDQGFEAIVGGNKYFAFFNYTQTDNQVVSHCDRTFTGWFHEVGVDAKHWGCFRGKKVNSDESYIHKYEMPPANNGVFVNDEELVRKINRVQNSWTATTYPQFEGMPRSQLLRMSGSIMPSFKSHARRQHMAEMRQYAKKQSNALPLNVPTSFDWRNVDGQNFVSPVRNQASCGSCYIFGTEAMFESRIKIATNNTRSPVYSAQEVNSCSSYSQGCQGGFPYLVEKYAEDFGVVEEKCYPYQGRDSECKETTCPRQYFTKYGYIGGYYGASTEQNMLEELLKNGPITVNFQVLSDFYFYKSGIYQHTKLGSEPEPFVEVNHSVLIVGYGEQDSKKYWIVKNSWGSGWGMAGYFWIIRGRDEVGIESLTSAATPVL